MRAKTAIVFGKLCRGKKLRCSTCGAPGDCGGTIAKCVNCWEVEKRLQEYLGSEGGRRFARALMKEMQIK